MNPEIVRMTQEAASRIAAHVNALAEALGSERRVAYLYTRFPVPVPGYSMLLCFRFQGTAALHAVIEGVA